MKAARADGTNNPKQSKDATTNIDNFFNWYHLLFFFNWQVSG
jgi:hypothetical protein